MNILESQVKWFEGFKNLLIYKNLCCTIVKKDDFDMGNLILMKNRFTCKPFNNRKSKNTL